MIITTDSQQAFENYLTQFFASQTPVTPTAIQIITSSNDANALLGTALGQSVYVGSNAANLPSSNNGSLTVLNDGNNNIYQRFDDYTMYITYYRISNNNGSTWSSWGNDLASYSFNGANFNFIKRGYIVQVDISGTFTATNQGTNIITIDPQFRPSNTISSLANVVGSDTWVRFDTNAQGNIWYWGSTFTGSRVLRGTMTYIIT